MNAEKTARLRKPACGDLQATDHGGSGGAQDVERAVKAARAAFADGS